MLIRELEKNTGLERATIRFYEKEGLVTPVRHENGYREYTQADCDTLLKVKLLRQLGMPLEMIRGLQQGSEDFSAALTDQIQALEHQIQDAGRAKAVCLELRDAGTTYDSLDASRYLHELTRTRPAEPAWTPQPVPEFRQTVLTHPWKRYFARRLDFVIFTIATEFLIVVLFRIRPFLDILNFLGIFWIRYLLWIPVEALLVHYFRTTPGKWLFGIQIESINGGPLPLSDAMHRAWDILRYGYGFNIPFYSIWRFYRSYRDYKDYGYAQWDYEWSAEYRFKYYFGTKRKVAMGLVIALCVGIFFTTLSDATRPVHRGEDLTVAQFAENYNRMLDEKYDVSSVNNDMYLEDNGTWRPAYRLGNVVVVDISGDPVIVYNNGSEEPGYSDFVYELEDGKIRSITYEQTWKNIFMLAPMSGRATDAAMSIASSQDWFNIFHYYDLMQQLASRNTTQAGSLVYENLEILWSADSVNCNFSDGMFYSTDEKNAVSSVTLQFKIIIHPTK